MKKEWNNPELKNLELDRTNEEVECSANQGQTRNGIHVPFVKCHHGLDYNALNCPYIKHLKCTYTTVAKS